MNEPSELYKRLAKDRLKLILGRQGKPDAYYLDGMCIASSRAGAEWQLARMSAAYLAE